jgi:GNAT superfamily N-acetyltransferase
MKPETLEAIARTWRTHLSFDGGFSSKGVSLQRRSAADADAWVRVVRIGDSIAVTVPDASPVVDQLTASTNDLADPEVLRQIVNDPADQLGPAELLFFDPDNAGKLAEFSVEVLDHEDLAISELLHASEQSGAGESGVEDVREPLSVARVDGRIVAACGWELWEPTVAQICVLVHPDHRGAGLSKLVTADATRRAVEAGLVPQWRSREGNFASSGLARSIGYELLGRQLSLLP